MEKYKLYKHSGYADIEGIYYIVRSNCKIYTYSTNLKEILKELQKNYPLGPTWVGNPFNAATKDITNRSKLLTTFSEENKDSEIKKFIHENPELFI